MAMTPLLRYLLGGASIVIILAGMKAGSSIIGFILLAAVLAMSITPLVNFMIDKGVKKSLALLIVILVIFIGGIGLISILGTSTVELARTIPTYESRIDELIHSFEKLLARFNIDAHELFNIEQIDPKRVLEFVSPVISGLLGALSNSLYLFLFIALMLVQFSGYEQHIKEGKYRKGSLHERMYEVRKDIRKYISITAFTGLLTSVANIILLLILGVDFAIFWGVLYFFFNFIPVIGAIVSTILPFLFTLIIFGWTKALIVLVGFVVFNSLSDNVLKPKLMQEGLEISIFLIFLSLVFWNFILGPIGAILAVPLTITVKRLYQELTPENSAT